MDSSQFSCTQETITYYQDAISVGTSALECLKDAKASLDGVKNWGVVDASGGGLLPGLMKQWNISDTKHRVEAARQALRAFTDALGDVYLSEDMNIEIDNFITFIELLWDGFLADWMVQSRIKKARKQLDQVIPMVEHLLSNLRQEGTIVYSKQTKTRKSATASDKK